MFKYKKSTYSIFLYNGTKKTTPRRRIASKNHSAGEGTKALARPPIAGGVGRSDRVGNCTTRIRQEFSESDDYNNYLQVLQYYPRRIFRPAPLPAERKRNPSGASAAAIAGANPISGKQITGKQITEKQINSKQEPAATIGNGQRTKKRFRFCGTFLHTAIRRLTPSLRQRRGTARRLRAWSS